MSEIEALGPFTPTFIPVPSNFETPTFPTTHLEEAPIDPALHAVANNAEPKDKASKSAWFDTPSTPIERPTAIKKPLIPNPFTNNFPNAQQPMQFSSRATTPASFDTSNHPTPPAIPIPTHLPNKSRPTPMSIPKIITDRLTDQEARIMELERQTADDADILASLREAQVTLQADYDDLENEHADTLKRLSKIEDAMEKQTETVSMLFDAIQKGGGTVGDGDSKVKVKRDNALNTAIRKTFFTAMGLPNKSKLKDAAMIGPTEAGGGYVKDSETSGRVLRPDWAASFTENSSWHNNIIKYMRQKVPVQQPAITMDMMKSKSDDDILDRVEVVFKNIATEARKLAKQPAAQQCDTEGEAEPSTNIVSDDNAQKLKENRRKGRKIRKCEERQSALIKAGVELPQGFNFFLQPQYQSTDESDLSDVLDPDTDTEDSKEVPAPSTRKPWISRTPYYRHDKFQNIVLKTDELVQKQRDEFQKNNKGKTPAHPRIRGEWKETRLPFINGGGKKPKIPRFAIHPEWLADHPEDDTPSRIQDEEKPGVATAREDEAMSGD
ncbi:hypothetical protein FB451DRAFT_1477687 [Mycena latifolia]|nr:hypothetical protein FB451DRAFT_1477687 [Mycena latifolia]